MSYFRNNLLSTTGESRNSNFAPWGQDESKQLFFCHGYNLNSKGVRAWSSEMFKRFYWSGNCAEFHAIHWYGFQSQFDIPWPISWIKDINYFTPDFHSNVFNAFKTAPEAAALINRLSTGKRAVLIGHSLGCMLASATVCIGGANVSDLVLANGAVAQEAYDPGADQPVNMIHEAWRKENKAYTNRVFASEWHTLFPEDDHRRNLTIRGLFSDHRGARFHQYYTPGDEATGNIREKLSTNPFTDAKYAAWCVQELFKGRAWRGEPTQNGMFGGSHWMGWGFHYPGSVNFFIPYTATEAQNLTDAELKHTPVFRNEPALFFSFSDAERQECARTNRYEFIARGIPARSFSIGANLLRGNSNFKSHYNMNEDVDRDEKNPWLRSAKDDEKVDVPALAGNGTRRVAPWKHNDIREMPYVNVRSFFSDIIEKTNLKGN